MSETGNSATTSSASITCDETSFWKPEHGLSGTVTIDVRALEESLDGFSRAWKTGKLDPAPRISFVSYELLHKVLAPNRMEIIRIMSGAGPLSIREVARRVERDFKGVHSDVKALLLSGVVDKAADGKVVFPYDRVRFDFEIGATTQTAA